MAPNQTMASSPVQNRGNDRNAPAGTETGEKSYFTLPRTSTIGHTPSNSTSKVYPNPASEPFSSANGEPTSFGTFMGFRHEDAGGRRQLGSSSFGGNGVGSGFPPKATFVPGDRDGSRPDDVMNRMSLPPFSQADSTSGPNRTSYTHLARNSTSFASPRPVHSAHPSFHSETQAFEPRFANGQMDLNTGLAKLDLSDHNLLAQQNSQRPNFVPYPSYDPSYNRLKSPIAGDEASVSQAPPYAPDGAAELPLGYPAGVPRLGDRDSTSPNGYNRGMNAAFYSAGGTTPVTATPYRTSSGNRLSNHASEGQAALLDRKLRGVQQQEPEFVLPAGRHPMQTRLHFPAYELPGFGAPPIAPFPGLYPMAPFNNLGPTTIVPRGPHREHDSSQVVRSALLEEFRSNNKGNKRYELKVKFDLFGFMAGGSLVTFISLTDIRTSTTILLNLVAINMARVSFNKSWRRRTATRKNRSSGKSNRTPCS